MNRKISTDAVSLLDGLLSKDRLSIDAQLNGDSRRLFVQAALACLGIKEVGKNGGEEVTLFQKTVGLNAGDAWCMCFVQTCLAYAELKTKKPSPLVASGACMAVWVGAGEVQRVKHIPLAGAVAIWQHTSDSGPGPTGIVLNCDGVSFHAIEGNTSKGYADLQGRVGQGDGVRYTHRRFDLFNPERGDMQLRGFIKPF